MQSLAIIAVAAGESTSMVESSMDAGTEELAVVNLAAAVDLAVVDAYTEQLAVLK